MCDPKRKKSYLYIYERPPGLPAAEKTTFLYQLAYIYVSPARLMYQGGDIVQNVPMFCL